MKYTKLWIRISLRTLLALITCFAIGIALFADYARTRKSAFAEIRQAGGNIRMDHRESTWLDAWLGPEVLGAVNEIDLRYGSANNELLKHVGKFNELRRLNLSSAKIDDEGLRSIAHLPLRELWLRKTQITDAAFETISRIETLELLQLDGTSLSDAFLEQLLSMPELVELQLRGTQVTGVGMKNLSRHPNLKKLDLCETEVDDSGVGKLVDCQSLTHVGLSMTKITNAVFVYLDKLPELTNVELTNMELTNVELTNVELTADGSVTTEAALEFQKSHPKCVVGWRTPLPGSSLIPGVTSKPHLKFMPSGKL